MSSPWLAEPRTTPSKAISRAAARLGLLLFALALPVAANPLDVFVITGQSNSLGTTADPNETDPSPGLHPADKQTRFFWSNRSTRAGDGPATLIGSSEAITRLQTQQGEGANKSFWGPEFGFARELHNRGLRNFFVIKASRGGGGNSFWLKGSPDDHMYQHVVATVNTALSQLPKEQPYRLRALLYVQGESDNAHEAKLAGQRLQTLINNLRQDLPHAAGMHLLVGEIAAAGARRDAIRRQQRAITLNNPHATYVESLDLQKQLYDRLHFNKPAKLELGQRLATAWLHAVDGEASRQQKNPTAPASQSAAQQ